MRPDLHRHSTVVVVHFLNTRSCILVRDTPRHLRLTPSNTYNCTGLFMDHALDDIIEPIGCQHLPKHILGRPKPPSWYTGFPLYIIDAQYFPAQRAFNRIATYADWLTTIPDEVRSSDFMPIETFDKEGKKIVVPIKLKSPFLRGVKGPGGLCEEGVVVSTTSLTNNNSDVPSTSTSTVPPKRHYTKRGTGEIAQRKAREAAEAQAKAAAQAATRPLTMPFQVRSAASSTQVAQHQKRKVDDRSVSAAAGGPAYMRDAKVEVLPAQTGMPWSQKHATDASMLISFFSNSSREV